mmetsp:Transcript_3046/g.6977  ORF Transcript_3046/g.6977 Transcript_3046/m.6977 type:complete len:80 (+) Transcript_3046:474-713(+)
MYVSHSLAALHSAPPLHYIHSSSSRHLQRPQTASQRQLKASSNRRGELVTSPRTRREEKKALPPSPTQLNARGARNQEP